VVETTLDEAGGPVEIRARRAEEGDIATLVGLYRKLEDEQTALKAMWRLADGLAEPVADSWQTALDDAETRLYLGEIDGFALGFLMARLERLLPQAGDERVAAIRLVFTDPEVRRVGVGEAMITAAIADLTAAGCRLFDAHVLPGHREAKNFFESNGFAARSIVMHHAVGGSM